MRTVIAVLYDKGEPKGARWQCVTTSSKSRIVFDFGPLKAPMVKSARAHCHSIKKYGEHAQLIIRGRNGRIQTEHTYGKDPRKSKG